MSIRPDNRAARRVLDTSILRRACVALGSIAPIALFCAGLTATACATTARPQLTEPQETIDAVRDAWREDDAGLFLHTLGKPVLREYSEHVIRIGWSEIRPRVGTFVEGAEVVETETWHETARDANVPAGFVWPDEGAQLMRVRLGLDGQEENFLLVLETDDPPEQSVQSGGFWIGDRYYVRREHSSPGTYLTEDSPATERTHWRLVFPYYPFQAQGPLTARLQQTLSEQK